MPHTAPRFDHPLPLCRRAMRRYTGLCIGAAVISTLIMPLVALGLPILTTILYPLFRFLPAALQLPLLLPLGIFAGAMGTMLLSTKIISHWAAQREEWATLRAEQTTLQRVRQCEKTGMLRGVVKAQKRWVKRRHRHGLPVLPLPREWQFLPASLQNEASEIERLRTQNKIVHARWQQKNWPDRAALIDDMRRERGR